MANGIEAIIAKIESDTNEYIAKLTQEHKQNLDQIEKEKNDKILEIKTEAEKTISLERSAAEESVSRRADATKRDMLLTEKTKLMDEVFSKAEAKLNSLNEQEYISFFAPMIKKACDGSGVSIDKITLIFPSNGRVDSNKLIEESKVGKVSFSDTGDFEAGFIMSTDEFEFDCTSHTLIYNNRERLQSIVTSVLFS